MKNIGIATSGVGIGVPGIVVAVILGFAAYGFYEFSKRQTA